MLAIAIESSHQRGMGHLYRMMNFFKKLDDENKNYIVFINNDNVACNILKMNKIQYRTVSYEDYDSNWETDLIKQYDIDIWVNDRLDTCLKHAINVKKNDIRLVTFDDSGDGADMADLNIAALVLDDKRVLKGKKILKGLEYLILNREIEKNRRIRKEQRRVIVTLGGSDTYGVTLKIVNLLRKHNIDAVVHVGPSFKNHVELEKLMDSHYRQLTNVDSLIEAFLHFDLAITGGGITPFEANASGLPCIIIANEMFEIHVGNYLQAIGSSIFAGYHENINEEVLSAVVDIEEMSRMGIEKIKLDGVNNVYEAIIKE
jgi:spore coat polysaccharide biosynthesis predicted glycosyltransferase SpsG